MQLNVSKKLLMEMKKNYVSAEYIVGEVLPMVNAALLKNLPQVRFFDNTEIIDFSDDLGDEIKKIFSDQWEIENIVQFLLMWGILMEV